MNLERLGAALRERREALGIPRAEIARRVGVTPTYIWLVEGAKPRKGGEPSRPAEAVLERWGRALGMDDRYTRQILLLAGYSAPGQDVALGASIQPTAALSDPAPNAFVPRFQVQMSHPSGGPATDNGPEQLGSALSFANAPLSFQQPRDLQTEVLLDQMRDLLRSAERSDEKWEETTRLLDSLLDWLRSRLERDD